MIRELKKEGDYIKILSILSVLSPVFGILHSFLGSVLILPLSVVTFALLFHFENPKKRIMSFIIPLLTVTLSLILSGWYGLISVITVIAALSLALCYRFMKNKAEASVYLSVLIFISIFATLYFSIAKEAQTFAPNTVAEFASKIIISLRETLINTVSSTIDKNLYDELAMKELFDMLNTSYDTVISLLVGIIAALSFVISGVVIKIFSYSTIRICKNGILKTFSHFVPSSAFAYFFIVIAIITAFPLGNNAFDLSLMNIRVLLLTVFLYMGIRSIQAMLDAVHGRTGFLFTVIFSFLLMPSLAVTVTAFLGAIFTIINSKASKAEQ